jgi:hypothetical protein
VNEAELRNRLLADALPGEVEAGQRSWDVIRAAYATRERVPWIERHSRAVLALAVIAVLAVAAVTPPGRALVESVREQVVGETPSEPALFRLPTAGRLLVESAQGAWVARQDGSKRRLGAYEAASWSPRGLFVVATRRHQLVALEPDGDVRWTVTRPGLLTDARWAPSGFRIAYREDDSLRVVVGNGEDDRLLARAVAPVAPAWRPGAATNVLAYAEPNGSVHVVDVDSQQELWSTPRGPTVTHLVWSGDGQRLLALSLGERQQLFHSQGRARGTIGLPAGHVVVNAAFAPAGDTLAYIDFDLERERSTLVLVHDQARRTLFTAEGRLEDVIWSPNGRWLLVTWPAADQWVFVRAPAVRGLVTVPHITREFDPGGTGPRPFPRVAGWIE